MKISKTMNFLKLLTIAWRVFVLRAIHSEPSSHRLQTRQKKSGRRGQNQSKNMCEKTGGGGGY
jgi:hypothetical protein